ncbi:TraC family protein, partial [Photobacterium damselae subsp. damselae]|nr:TraC family protein [Photobacterium damselae subsp. damselae]
MSGIVDHHNSILKFNQYGDLLPVLEYLPELKGFVLDGGYLGFTFICQPLTGVNEDLMNAMDDLYQRSFPDNSFMQISLFGSPYIKDTLDRFGSIREGRAAGEMGELYDSIGRSTYEYFMKSTAEPLNPNINLKVRDFEVWVSFKMPLKKQEPNEEEVKAFRRMYLQLRSTLEGIGCAPYDMDAALYVHRMQILHNHNADAAWRDGIKGHDAGLPLRYQVMERNNPIFVQQDGIQI